jgi:hypothetical protein
MFAGREIACQDEELPQFCADALEIGKGGPSNLMRAAADN